MGNKFKPNVLLLAFGGLVVVIALAFIFPAQADMVLALGAALIGGFVGVMKDLVSPDPAPPAKVVPMEVHQELIRRFADVIATEPEPAPASGRSGKGAGS